MELGVLQGTVDTHDVLIQLMTVGVSKESISKLFISLCFRFALFQTSRSVSDSTRFTALC